MGKPVMHQNLFSWVPFYEELADRLLLWQERQAELLNLIAQLRTAGHFLPELEDQGADGSHFPLREIDPFTIFALFNRGLKDDNRRRLATALGQDVGVTVTPPVDFAGIPVVHNQRTRFFVYAKDRKAEDIPALWTVFKKALSPQPLDDAEFANAFDAALHVSGVRFNLTMGLFWIRPRIFLSLDGVLQNYIGLAVKAQQLNAQTYINTVRAIARRGIPFPQLSYDAWLASRAAPVAEIEEQSLPEESITDPENVPIFWFVGAYWSGEDQTSRFLADGIWENGYEDRFLEQVKAMRPGEKIAIKASFTRKHDLPFETSGRAASVMTIKAVGTILGNTGNGQQVTVNWDKEFNPARNWYFYTNRQTVWGIRRGEKSYNDYLIDFAFFDRNQDYTWFLHQPYWAKWLSDEPRAGVLIEEPDERLDEEAAEPLRVLPSYGIDDILKEGAFLPRSELQRFVDLLRSKKNLVLQGPPGVGKTFLAQKVAFAMLRARDPSRVYRVQFHQSMSYEDFVRGLRPKPGVQGFELVDGPFLEVAEAARVSPDEKEHVLIIEEINRGNPSGIFGELLTLLEADKRVPEYAIRLTHQRAGESAFHVPPNMYVIGTMNLADRSLAVLDHALRRRFAFASLSPTFGGAFLDWCCKQGMTQEFAVDMVARVEAVNRVIVEDTNLGRNFLLGHSYFCPRHSDLEGRSVADWYREAVLTQVLPLLEEYWYDDPERLTKAQQHLLDGVLAQ